MNHALERVDYGWIRFRFTSGLFAELSPGAQEFKKHRLALRQRRAFSLVESLGFFGVSLQRYREKKQK
jgi:hypothetical protein